MENGAGLPDAGDYTDLAASGRRRARETALLMLYQLDFGENDAQMAARTLADIGLDEENAAFALELVERSRAYRSQADVRIAELSREWDFARLFSIDVAILRLALCEMTGETPANIVINEAVELAKKFGDNSSPAFVNAVLDAVHQNSGQRPEDRSQRREELRT